MTRLLATRFDLKGLLIFPPGRNGPLPSRIDGPPPHVNPDLNGSMTNIVAEKEEAPIAFPSLAKRGQGRFQIPPRPPFLKGGQETLSSGRGRYDAICYCRQNHYTKCHRAPASGHGTLLSLMIERGGVPQKALRSAAGMAPLGVPRGERSEDGERIFRAGKNPRLSEGLSRARPEPQLDFPAHHKLAFSLRPLSERNGALENEQSSQA